MGVGSVKSPVPTTWQPNEGGREAVGQRGKEDRGSGQIARGGEPINHRVGFQTGKGAGRGSGQTRGKSPQGKGNKVLGEGVRGHWGPITVPSVPVGWGHNKGSRGQARAQVGKVARPVPPEPNVTRQGQVHQTGVGHRARGSATHHTGAGEVTRQGPALSVSGGHGSWGSVPPTWERGK